MLQRRQPSGLQSSFPPEAMTHPKTPQAMYDELAAKIEEAVPTIRYEKHSQHGDLCRNCFRDVVHFGAPKECRRPITLEDVLRSPFKTRINLNQYGAIFVESEPWAKSKWHLGHDLSWHRDNAPETIAFLHSLLCR